MAGRPLRRPSRHDEPRTICRSSKCGRNGRIVTPPHAHNLDFVEDRVHRRRHRTRPLHAVTICGSHGESKIWRCVILSCPGRNVAHWRVGLGRTSRRSRPCAATTPSTKSLARLRACLSTRSPTHTDANPLSVNGHADHATAKLSATTPSRSSHSSARLCQQAAGANLTERSVATTSTPLGASTMKQPAVLFRHSPIAPTTPQLSCSWCVHLETVEIGRRAICLVQHDRDQRASTSGFPYNATYTWPHRLAVLPNIQKWEAAQIAQDGRQRNRPCSFACQVRIDCFSWGRLCASAALRNTQHAASRETRQPRTHA